MSGAQAQAPDPNQSVGISSSMPGLVLWDQCGWEGQRPCTSNDPIFGAVNSTSNSLATGCDITLFPINHVCTDKGARHNASVPGGYAPGWLQSQQSDQYNRISADLPMNLVPILGTHNSYSNSADGGSEIINLDQHFTITDQLNLGARFVRLDPVNSANGQSVMGCHISDLGSTFSKVITDINLLTRQSYPTNASQLCATSITNLTFAQSLDGAFSFQRPIYLAVEEIQHWLANNPAEVVFITVNNFYSSGQSGYVDPADLSAIFLHVLGNMLLTPQQYQTMNSPTPWPTIRQMRALGKQAMVFFSNSSGASGVWDPSPQDTSLAHWPSTSNPNFPACLDFGGMQVGPGRDATKSEWNGEDRSLSNAFNASDESGLMTWQNVVTATQCGYGTISLDFLYSLGSAVNNTYIPYPGSVNFTTGGNFYSADSGLDERPQWLIWSWLRNTPVAPSGGGPAALVRQNLSGEDLGVSLVFEGSPVTANIMDYRWQQMGASNTLPFACAGPYQRVAGSPFPDPSNMWVYSWAITTVSDVWANGETECQNEFGSGFHFWHPMSAPEDKVLVNAMMSLGVGQVWLNYNPGATVAFPSQVTLNHTLGGSNTGADVVVAGGFGGELTASFVPDPGSPNFLLGSQNIPGSNIFHLTANDTALAGVKSGQFHGVLTITEQHPDNSPSSSSRVSVFLNFSNSNTFGATPPSVNFTTSLTQTVRLGSSPAPVGFTYSKTHQPPWLTVTFNQMTTPATMTLVADPQGAPFNAPMTYSLTLTPTDSNFPPLTIPVTIQVANVTIKASPFAATPATIDGNSVTLPAPEIWVVGSTHQVSLPSQFTPDQATYYKFNNWSGPQTGTPFLNITVPAGTPIYTGQYNTRYTLTLSSSPTAGGTVTPSPAPDSLGTLPAGTQVTLTAAAATGFVFKQFTGASTSQQSPATITLNAPASATGMFVAQQAQTTFNTNPPGLTILVDGVSYPTPANFAWATTETHSVAGPTQTTAPGTQVLFTSWSDHSTASPRTFSGSATPVSYTLNFGQTQYLVSAQVVPSLSGSVTGAGWYSAGTQATLQATAAQGFNFSSYSGGISSTQPIVPFTVTGPVQVSANFTGVKPPLLYASSAARIDNGDGTVVVPIILNDLASAGPAGNAAITGVSVVTVPLGAGPPTINPPATPYPVGVGTLLPGQSSPALPLTVVWPTSATRVTFNIQFAASGGYSGSTNLTIFR
ncbi:MAG TPA: hypothetical protein VKB79_15575 [Bryobacteraceae bacterium]|nr:hypothetical protein [Bryobacteraceae bacterium]